MFARVLGAVSLLVALAGPALSHDMAAGPNGGPVADSGGHHVEMLARPAELVFVLSEHDGKPIAAAGARNARAIVQDKGKTATVPLQAGGGADRLVGTLAAPLGTGARVVMSATLADGHAVQARFVVR